MKATCRTPIVPRTKNKTGLGKVGHKLEMAYSFRGTFDSTLGRTCAAWYGAATKASTKSAAGSLPACGIGLVSGARRRGSRLRTELATIIFAKIFAAVGTKRLACAAGLAFPNGSRSSVITCLRILLRQGTSLINTATGTMDASFSI